MTGRAAEERALACIGALLVGVALLANEFVLARLLSADGAFEGSTLTAVRAFGAALLAGGATIIGLRAKIAAVPGVDPEDGPVVSLA